MTAPHDLDQELTAFLRDGPTGCPTRRSTRSAIAWKRHDNGSSSARGGSPTCTSPPGWRSDWPLLRSSRSSASMCSPSTAASSPAPRRRLQRLPRRHPCPAHQTAKRPRSTPPRPPAASRLRPAPVTRRRPRPPHCSRHPRPTPKRFGWRRRPGTRRPVLPTSRPGQGSPDPQGCGPRSGGAVGPVPRRPEAAPGSRRHGGGHAGSYPDGQPAPGGRWRGGSDNRLRSADVRYQTRWDNVWPRYGRLRRECGPTSACRSQYPTAQTGSARPTTRFPDRRGPRLSATQASRYRSKGELWMQEQLKYPGRPAPCTTSGGPLAPEKGSRPEANVVMPGMVTATSASSESTEHVPPHPAGKNTPTRQQWSGSVPADSLRQPSRTEGSRLQVLRNSPCARLISAEPTGDSGRVPFARSGGPRRATPPGDDARTRTSTRRNDPRTRPLALERKSRPTRSCRGWSLPRQPRESRRRTCPRPSGEEHADSALGKRQNVGMGLGRHVPTPPHAALDAVAVSLPPAQMGRLPRRG